MNLMLRNVRAVFAMLAVLGGVFAGGAGMAAAAETVVTLSGDQEVPAVKTAASGSGSIAVNADKSVSGNVTTTGMAGIMAHIHEAPPGQSGAVIIPLQQTAANVWSVPPGAKLTDAQYKRYEAGDLYVNVHSKAYPGGEIRGQIKP